MKGKLGPMENSDRRVSNFTGRIKEMHVFVGNFTYVTDFMIVEDISSIIDPRLSQVVLGKPFVDTSNMTHDPPEGVVRFTNRTDEIAYKMPHKIEQYNSLSDLEKKHTKSVYLRNEEDKRRGVELSKFEADFKQQQGEMTNKIDTMLKAITDRIAGALPSDTIDIEEPLDLVNTSEESVYESLIKDKKGDPSNLKIPCMIGHKFTANAYIDVDLPMNLMSLAYYNSIRKNRYEYRGRNFIGLGRDMHVFVGSMSYVIDFTILENIETNIDPSLSHVIFGGPFLEIACLAINRKHGLMTFTYGTKEITFKTPYKDPEMSELSIEGYDLLSSRIILSEDDYDIGCRKPSDLEEGFYRDTIKFGPEYVTGMDD
ncbi:hypothetical protein Tco_0916184, partial [Tanacetum coccineum]